MREGELNFPVMNLMYKSENMGKNVLRIKFSDSMSK